MHIHVKEKGRNTTHELSLFVLVRRVWSERKTREKKWPRKISRAFSFSRGFLSHRARTKRKRDYSLVVLRMLVSVCLFKWTMLTLSYLCSDIRVHASSQQDQYNVNSVLLGSNMQRSKSILCNSETTVSVSTLSAIGSITSQSSREKRKSSSTAHYPILFTSRWWIQQQK